MQSRMGRGGSPPSGFGRGQEGARAGCGPKRALNVRVDGQLVFNGAGPLLQAALNGFGLAYLMERHVQPYVSDGRLVRVLADWCPPFSGYHLYYPSRRQPSPAFSLLVEALRYRGN